jgi:hypothetical protein
MRKSILGLRGAVHYLRGGFCVPISECGTVFRGGSSIRPNSRKIKVRVMGLYFMRQCKPNSTATETLSHRNFIFPVNARTAKEITVP